MFTTGPLVCHIHIGSRFEAIKHFRTNPQFVTGFLSLFCLHLRYEATYGNKDGQLKWALSRYFINGTIHYRSMCSF